VSVLSYFFNSIPIPDSFQRTNLKNVTFVTIDDSIVLDAILLSIARRAGLNGIASCKTPPESRSSLKMYRTHYRDETTLSWLFHHSPSHQFVTVSTIHGAGPIKSTRNYSINLLDALSLILWKSSLVVVFGEARDLSSHLVHPDRKVSRAFKVDFYGNLKLIRGTPFQPLRSQSDAILSGKDFQQECTKLTRDLGISPTETTNRCRKSFYELSANPVRWVYLVLGRIAKIIIWQLFSEVRVEGINAFTSTSKNQPTVIVPMHRSHLDYILLGSVMYNSRLNTPLVAAGINLNFWPMGYFLRRVGAFFVKRSGGSDQIHSLVLRRYLSYLLKRGHLLEFFIEGGRSRTGRMRTPKLGLLKIIVSAYQRGLRRDVAFVPVSISYEQVIEDKALADENLGGQKVEENVKTLFKARSIFRRSYGEVVVSFAEPISMTSFVAQPQHERGTLVTALAQELTYRMRMGTNPTLTALACSSLLMAPRYALEAHQFSESVKNLSLLIDVYRCVEPKIGASTNTLKATIESETPLTEWLTVSGLTQSQTLFGRRVFTIPENRRMTADFYKNSTVHLFMPFSFLAISELVKGSIEMSFIKKLHEIFKHEYLLEQTNDFIANNEKLIEELQRRKLVVDAKGKLKFSGREIGLFIPSLMLSSVQTNLWVLYHLSQAASAWPDSNTPRINYDDFLNELLSQHSPALDVELMTRTETFSRSGIESALESLTAQGILSSVPARKGPRHIRIIQPEALDRSFLFEINEKIIYYMQSTGRDYRQSLL